MAEYKKSQNYRKLRAKSYPELGDQLDALWKIVDILLDRESISDPAIINMIDDIKRVKGTYPPKGT